MMHTVKSNALIAKRKQEEVERFLIEEIEEVQMETMQ